MKFKVIDQEINQVRKAKNVILFVHGIMGNNYDKPNMIHMAQKLIPNFSWNKKEDVVLAFDYESLNTSVEQTSDDLLHRLEEMRFPEKTADTNYILIAHSMGGLVSRFLLEQKGGNKYFNHFIQVGTPNNGSPLATVFKGMEYGVTFAINYFVPKQYSFPLSFLMKAWGQINNTAHELATASKTCKKLNTKGTDPRMPYHIILGDMSFKDNEASLRAMKGVEEAIEQQNRVKKLLTKIEKKSLDAMLGEHGAHDGIVPVTSMRKVLQIAAAQEWTIQPKAYSTYSHHFKYFSTEPSVEVIAKLLK
jgi:pimeloyl-ACP methyl ester carboxylesterase